MENYESQKPVLFCVMCNIVKEMQTWYNLYLGSVKENGYEQAEL
ncbi:MAG: hypothetical protein OSJ59_06230 [Lachnospiraceae bacterium]|nr:hypothetical protein [Lachnospiraceae bacterium]